jgi:hypothetical protein
MTIDPGNLGVGNFNYDGVARPRPGITPERAARELSDQAWRITEFPNTFISGEMLRSARFATRVVPLRTRSWEMSSGCTGCCSAASA